jgi:predicted nucleic acid-binding protein
MILIETSVWIDLLRGVGRWPELASMLRSDAPMASTEPILMELLAGTRNEIEYTSVRRLGTSLIVPLRSTLIAGEMGLLQGVSSIR